ncbi:MAG: hypothetical protein QOE96_456 [Blastocatellia bacterium]|jgi:hypothetical protein|nr:hypothetical protein [Blastocatellia bacterium]
MSIKDEIDTSALTTASRIARERIDVALGLDSSSLTAASRIARERMDAVSGSDSSSLPAASRVARERMDAISGLDSTGLTATSKIARERLDSSILHSASAVDFRSQFDTAIGIASHDPLSALNSAVNTGLSVTALLDSPGQSLNSQVACLKDTISVLGEMQRPYNQFSAASDFAPYIGSITNLASVSGIAASIEHLSSVVSPISFERISSLVGTESVGVTAKNALANIDGIQLHSPMVSSLPLGAVTGDIAGITLASTRTLLGIESAYAKLLDTGFFTSLTATPTEVPSYIKTLHEGLGSLSSAAKSSWDSIALTPAILDRTSLFSARSPSVEIYSASQAAAVISLPLSNFPPIDAQIEGIIDETVDEFEGRLSLLEPALVEMYHGGIGAMETGGPDWRRQSMTSFRELMTHVMHILAPDAKVKPWAKPQHFDKGRLTRQARLEYIFESVADGEFTGFFKADLKASIELFDLLNNGTHRLTSKATPEQLRYLRGRIVNFITCMLEAKGH